MEDFDKIISAEIPTLVDFFATWCRPCQIQGPILEEVKHELGDKVNIIKVDIDKNRALSDRFNVRSVPTLIVFRNGEAIWRESGLHSRDQLKAKLTELESM